MTRGGRRSASSRSWRLNERPVLHWWRRSFPDSRAAQVALKDQQKMAPVSHTYWESTLPLTLSLCDFGNLFCPLARQRRARPNTAGCCCHRPPSSAAPAGGSDRHDRELAERRRVQVTLSSRRDRLTAIGRRRSDVAKTELYWGARRWRASG